MQLLRKIARAVAGVRFFRRAFDGGPDSTVTGWWLVEAKGWFSIAVLRFADGSRENYHSHAFNSWSWVVRGRLREEHLPVHEPGPHVVDTVVGKITLGSFTTSRTDEHRPSWRAVRTLRNTFHRVFSIGTTWVLTVRGPWAERWLEYDPRTDEIVTLETPGRREVERRSANTRPHSGSPLLPSEREIEQLKADMERSVFEALNRVDKISYTDAERAWFHKGLK